MSESKRFYKGTQICMFHLLAFLKYLLLFAAGPSWTNYYLLYFFGFDDISKRALSTLSIKYV